MKVILKNRKEIDFSYLNFRTPDDYFEHFKDSLKVVTFSPKSDGLVLFDYNYIRISDISAIVFK